MLDKARDAFQAVLRMQPANSLALGNLAGVFFSLGARQANSFVCQADEQLFDYVPGRGTVRTRVASHPAWMAAFCFCCCTQACMCAQPCAQLQ